jgi:hypothetical protein
MKYGQKKVTHTKREQYITLTIWIMERNSVNYWAIFKPSTELNDWVSCLRDVIVEIGNLKPEIRGHNIEKTQG